MSVIRLRVIGCVQVLIMYACCIVLYAIFFDDAKRKTSEELTRQHFVLKQLQSIITHDKVQGSRLQGPEKPLAALGYSISSGNLAFVDRYFYFCDP